MSDCFFSGRREKHGKDEKGHEKHERDTVDVSDKAVNRELPDGFADEGTEVLLSPRDRAMTPAFASDRHVVESGNLIKSLGHDAHSLGGDEGNARMAGMTVRLAGQVLDGERVGLPLETP